MVLARRPSRAPAAVFLERSQRDGVDVLTLVGGRGDHASYPGDASEVEAFFERVLVEFSPAAVLATHLLWHSPAYVRIASRLGIPTASEFATILAKGRGDAESKTRRTYMAKLAGERLTGDPAENYTNAHFDRGHAMEPEAREMYAFAEGVEPQLDHRIGGSQIERKQGTELQ